MAIPLYFFKLTALRVLARSEQQRPLVCVWKSDGRYEEYSAANDSKVHKYGFISLSLFPGTLGVYQKLQEDIISSELLILLLHSRVGD